MTDDLGPDEEITEDLSAFFDAYLVSAAGLAAERGDGEVAELLSQGGTVRAAFAEFPVTSEDGHARANVDVTVAGVGDQRMAERVAELLNEVVAADGYHVGRVRFRPPGG